MVTRRAPQSILAEVSATLASSLAAEDILATVARQIGEAMGVFSCSQMSHEKTPMASPIWRATVARMSSAARLEASVALTSARMLCGDLRATMGTHYHPRCMKRPAAG